MKTITKEYILNMVETPIQNLNWWAISFETQLKNCLDSVNNSVKKKNVKP